MLHRAAAAAADAAAAAAGQGLRSAAVVGHLRSTAVAVAAVGVQALKTAVAADGTAAVAAAVAEAVAGTSGGRRHALAMVRLQTGGLRATRTVSGVGAVRHSNTTMVVGARRWNTTRAVGHRRRLAEVAD